MDPSQETKPELRLQRRYPVAPAKVWRAWTDPQALSAWFGPGQPNSVTLAEMDVRPGGRYRIRFDTPDGEEHEVSGAYEVVEPEQRLVFSWAWRSTPERESLVTVQIEPDGSGCELVLMHQQFFDEAARDGHNHGWTGGLVKLERWLGNNAAA
jgi:uncharacterized protein YndB with AHSA1/START domain